MLQHSKNPAALAGAHRVAEVIKLDGFDTSSSTAPHKDIQASRIRDTFKVSWPVARVTAELAFANGGRQ